MFFHIYIWWKAYLLYFHFKFDINLNKNALFVSGGTLMQDVILYNGSPALLVNGLSGIKSKTLLENQDISQVGEMETLY